MNIKQILLLLAVAVVASGCQKKSIAGNVYINPAGEFLYIVDAKYAKNNYDIKRETIETVSYELKDGKFIYSGIGGQTVLEISDDQNRIFGNSGVLQVDLRKSDKDHLDAEAKRLLGF